MSTKQCVTDIANTPTPWESGKLGRDKQYAVAASKELGDQIDDALGLQMISIRLDKEVIDTFKLLGEKYQIGYQSLMREALRRFVDDELKTLALEVFEKQSLTKSLTKTG
ncbi:BrnA antitoxin family protein [Polynucleobacter sp.]|uniref:BrnA antitoxin family protein n=1 Tax=Polynucleobacter sp. TaxID=2029855 RepID=UPI00273465FB|nr:BrnA antitoxin family protein [Polynucleobacter sp.]MDP3122745.1 BrnA antitoxin family protein [Polynucleobacter sp.]